MKEIIASLLIFSSFSFVFSDPSDLNNRGYYYIWFPFIKHRILSCLQVKFKFV